eukprot:1195153-Prorocentrum_minimum.AAC.1
MGEDPSAVYISHSTFHIRALSIFRLQTDFHLADPSSAVRMLHTSGGSLYTAPSIPLQPHDLSPWRFTNPQLNGQLNPPMTAGAELGGAVIGGYDYNTWGFASGKRSTPPSDRYQT